MINRNLVLHDGPTLRNVSFPPGTKFYDLYNGVELPAPTAITSLERGGELSFKIERFGAVLATTNSTDDDLELKTLLSTMAEFAKVDLGTR